jgi:hypothetical protein
MAAWAPRGLCDCAPSRQARNQLCALRFESTGDRKMRASPPRSTRVCCRVITGYRSQTVNPKQTENYTYFPAVKGRCWIARRDAQHQLLDRAMRHGALSQLIGLRPLAPGRFTNSGVQEAPGSVCAESPLGSRVSIWTLTLFERSPLLSHSRPSFEFRPYSRQTKLSYADDGFFAIWITLPSVLANNANTPNLAHLPSCARVSPQGTQRRFKAAVPLQSLQRRRKPGRGTCPQLWLNLT